VIPAVPLAIVDHLLREYDQMFAGVADNGLTAPVPSFTEWIKANHQDKIVQLINTDSNAL
jgi:hypothetical protein